MFFSKLYLWYNLITVMKLFDILPEKFYSILNGKNKDIYVSSLILLYRMINENDMVVKKSEFTRSLKESLNDCLNSFSIEEEEGESLENSFPTIASKASLITRRLEETGWIVIDVDGENLEEFIVIPSYSIKTISSIFDIVNESSEGYSSLVHTTYSELVIEDNAKDEFMYATLVRAFENTKKLRIDLITLSHSIKIYQNRLNQLYSSNEVLHSYYDNYKELISDRLYHPLKTFDSVTRFKRPIVNILNSWLNDSETKNLLVKQALIYSKAATSVQTAELDIIEKINYICDNYDALHKMIDTIDKSHRDYTKSSTNKILYLNNNDKSVKGNLETILTAFGKYKKSYRILRQVLTDMQDSIALYENGYLNADSIQLPFFRKSNLNSQPLAIMDDELLTDAAMENFISQVNGMFTDEMVFKFTEEVFEDKDKVEMEDIRIVNFDVLILIILATIKRTDPNAFYEVDFESKEKVRTQGYILPKMTFRRKEK